MKTALKNKASGLPFAELYAMRFTFIAGASLLTAAGLIYCFVSGIGDWRIFTGILFGSTVSAVNFYLLAYSIEKTLGRKKAESAKRVANIWYGARFIGMAAVFSFLFALDLANIFASLIPLFFPRIHYFITAIKK